MPTEGPDSSVGVQNTGPAPIDVDAITRADGSVVYRQRADVGISTDILNIRRLVEKFFALWTSNKPILLPSGRALPFDLGRNLAVGLGVSSGGGAKVSSLIALGTTNATLVKNTAGQVYGWYIFNAAASTRYVKIYNSNKPPSVGNDTPVIRFGIPAGAAANLWCASGIGEFTSGIGFATTTGIADSDATAVTANDLLINFWYA